MVLPWGQGDPVLSGCSTMRSLMPSPLKSEPEAPFWMKNVPFPKCTHLPWAMLLGTLLNVKPVSGVPPCQVNWLVARQLPAPLQGVLHAPAPAHSEIGRAH